MCSIEKNPINTPRLLRIVFWSWLLRWVQNRMLRFKNSMPYNLCKPNSLDCIQLNGGTESSPLASADVADATKPLRLESLSLLTSWQQDASSQLFTLAEAFALLEVEHGKVIPSHLVALQGCQLAHVENRKWQERAEASKFFLEST